MHGNFADLYYSPQVDQSLVINLVLCQQLGVLAEVAQEPAQFPHRPGRAVDTSDHETLDQMFGLEHGETDLVIRFMLVPAILGPIQPVQEGSVWNRVNSQRVRRAERLDVVFGEIRGFELTQTALGRILGEGQTQLSKYEMGQSSPTLEVLLRL
jgi:Helix-turn-helix